MPRALFEKTGNAIYISHLDLMRVFQRAFKRADLHLTHTQGFNPRPSVSIALPLSLGVESHCEFLDFDLEGDQLPLDEIRDRLNEGLIAGVCVREVYSTGRKLKELALLESVVILEYDKGVTEETLGKIRALFAQPELLVEKKGKNGVKTQDLIPMIRRLTAERAGEGEITLHVLASCQDPALNPMQLAAAVTKYLPELTPDFVRCQRLEVFDTKESIFR